MTTIAASLSLGMMAADSRATLFMRNGDQSHAYPCSKLIRTQHWIIGCAGDQRDIDQFMLWLSDRRKRRRKVIEDFEALMLSRTHLYFITDDCLPEPVRNGFHAIGSGGGYALAALNAMCKVGVDPDPRIAVAVACEHDGNSGPPIDFLRWKLTNAKPAES